MAPQSFGMMVARKDQVAMVAEKRFTGRDFRGLTSDSRKAAPGFLFAALAGSTMDGARFIANAVGKGAIAVLGKPDLADEVKALGVPFIPDENPRLGLA